MKSIIREMDLDDKVYAPRSMLAAIEELGRNA